jgi:predicted metal-dependent phosphoesterase TrpH
MKYELHCHTHYSKGTKIPKEALLSPEDIFRVAKKKGFSGVAITDHRVNTAWKEARLASKKYGVMFIPGIEVESDKGHVLAIGINEFVKSFQPLDETIDEIHSQGGIAIAAHPFDLRNDGARKDLEPFDAVEVFNSLCHDRFSNYLAEHWAREKRKPMVSGTDVHTEGMFGCSCNHIDATSLDGVLKAIKKGDVKYDGRYVPMSVMVKWFRDRLISSRKEVLEHVEKNYHQPKRFLARLFLESFTHSESRAWQGLAYFSYSLATVYSFLRALKYY